MTFLQTLWFLLICVLWTGYLVLEGFDFGVGMLVRAVARTDAEKRSVLHSIGPVWDGNEVWGKDERRTWRTAWEWALIVGSAVPALLWGVAWANIVRGVPLDLHGEFDGTLLTLLNPYAILGGVASLLLFLGHGVEVVSAALVALAAVLALAAGRPQAPGRAFGLTALTIVALFAGLWVEL